MTLLLVKTLSKLITIGIPSAVTLLRRLGKVLNVALAENITLGRRLQKLISVLQPQLVTLFPLGSNQRIMAVSIAEGHTILAELMVVVGIAISVTALSLKPAMDRAAIFNSNR